MDAVTPGLPRADFGCIFTPEANAVGFMVHGASDDGDGAAALVSALYDAAGIPPPADLHAPVGAAGNGTDHIDTATAADLPLPSAAVRKQRRGSDAGDGADAGGDTRAPNMAEEVRNAALPPVARSKGAHRAQCADACPTLRACREPSRHRCCTLP